MISQAEFSAIISDTHNSIKFIEGQSEVAQMAQANEFAEIAITQALKAERKIVADWIEMEGVAYNGGCSIHNFLAKRLRSM